MRRYQSTRILLSIVLLSILLVPTLPIIPVKGAYIPGETHRYVSSTDDLWSDDVVEYETGGYVVPSEFASWSSAVECWEHPQWKKNLEPNDFKANGADWIWNEYKVTPTESKTGSIVFFTKQIMVPESFEDYGYIEVSLDITVDSAFYFYINNEEWTGTPIGSAGFAENYDPMNPSADPFYFYSEDDSKYYPLEDAVIVDVSSWSTIQHYDTGDLAEYLEPGENWLQIVAVNCRPPPRSKQISVNTAGVIYQIVVSTEVETFQFPADPAWAATVSLDEYPPVDVDVALTPFVPTPIQAVVNPDINGDTVPDLVQGKPMAILVDVSGVTEDISVTVTFESVDYTTTRAAADIATNSILILPDPDSPDYPIIPQSTGSTVITGEYTAGSDDPVLFDPVAVTVKDTFDLSVYYSYLYRVDRRGNLIDYEEVAEADYTLMVDSGTQFLNETYPVDNLIVDDTYQGIAGEKKSNKDQFEPILLDAMAVADAAKSGLGETAIGVAIGPNATGAGADSDYFTYHGLPDYAAISFGPAVRGVVVQEGYWTAIAHEMGHVFGLYWYEPEQYQQHPLYGMDADGVSVSTASWRSGVGLMGAAPYRSLEYNWVTDYTYTELFKQTAMIPEDPPTIVVSAVVYANGTVAYPYEWRLIEDGYPDPVPAGDYAIVFRDADGNYLGETAFELEFMANVIPRIGTSEEITTFGPQTLNFSAFHFATAYPEGAVLAQIVNNTSGSPVVLDEVNLDFDTWVSSASYDPLTSFDVLFDETDSGVYTLQNTNPGTMQFNVDVNGYSGPLNITIDLPTTVNSQGDVVPAFDLQGNTPVNARYSGGTGNAPDPIIDIAEDGQRILIILDIPDGESVYIRIHIEYALKGEEGWQFATGPEDYAPRLVFLTTFAADGEPTLIVERSCTAVGRR